MQHTHINEMKQLIYPSPNSPNVRLFQKESSKHDQDEIIVQPKQNTIEIKMNQSYQGNHKRQVKKEETEHQVKSDPSNDTTIVLSTTSDIQQPRIASCWGSQELKRQLPWDPQIPLISKEMTLANTQKYNSSNKNMKTKLEK